MLSSRTTKIRFSLAAALAATLGACEDVPRPSKPHPPIAAEPPRPAPLASPPPVMPSIAATPTPTPEVKPAPVTEQAADDDVKPGDPISGARKMLEVGKLDKALRLANLAVRRTPTRSAAWNALGRVQLQMGKRSDAITSFGKAVELNPRNSYAQNNLGLALIYDKRFGEAVDVLEQAVELEPVEAYMWNNLGMAYEQLNRLEEARDAYDKAVEMESDRARESLARLEGVKTVFRTARADTERPATGGAKVDAKVEAKVEKDGTAAASSDSTPGPEGSAKTESAVKTEKDELGGQL